MILTAVIGMFMAVPGMVPLDILVVDDSAVARKKIAEAGVKINVIPADELNRWRKATDALDDQ